MRNLTVRNLPDETHRALRVRAARYGRSTEAEVRAILEEIVRPAGGLKIDTELHQIAQEIGGIDETRGHFYYEAVNVSTCSPRNQE